MEANYNGEDKEIINVRQSDNVIGYLLASIIRSYYCFRIEHDVAFISKLNLLSLTCIIISKINKKNIIVDWDDLDSEFQKNVFRKYLTIFVEYFFPRFIPVITTHNNSISVYAKSRKANSVFFIPQIIDLDLFDPFKYDRNKIKVDLGLKDYKVLVYLGSLNEGRRDLEVVAEAVKRATGLVELPLQELEIDHNEEKKKHLKQFFTITEEELDAVGEEKLKLLVLERVALLDVLK